MSYFILDSVVHIIYFAFEQWTYSELQFSHPTVLQFSHKNTIQHVRQTDRQNSI